MQAALPSKLKEDAIVEALLEIQFESDDLGEIVIGRLSDFDQWSGCSSQRLNASNIPEGIRDSDPALRYQPVIERRSQDGASNARIGSHVLSYHAYAPYLGWSEFRPKLFSIVDELFKKTTNLRITRLGFRYINYLQSGKHSVESPADLTLSIMLGEEPIVGGFNLSYLDTISKHHHILTRVVSPDFIESATRPDDVVCAADIDVFTAKDFTTGVKEDILKWIEDAHTAEKEAFFCLFKKDTIELLKSE